MYDSREIAKLIGRRHNNLLRDIRNLIKRYEDSGLDASELFVEGTYVTADNRSVTKYNITREGLNLLLTRLTGDSFVKVVDKYGEVLRPAYIPERNETSFGSYLIEFMESYDLNVTPQYKVGDYRIDFYIPKLRLAVEYDESHHKYRKEYDRLREKEIAERLEGVTFVRLFDTMSHIKNITFLNKVLQSFFLCGKIELKDKEINVRRDCNERYLYKNK